MNETRTFPMMEMNRATLERRQTEQVQFEKGFWPLKHLLPWKNCNEQESSHPLHL